MSPSPRIALDTTVIQSAYPDGTAIFTSAPSLPAPIAAMHVVYAGVGQLPVHPGELEVLLEWMQRGTKRRSRRDLSDAFGAMGVEPALVSMAGGVVFTVQALDAVHTPVTALAREMLYEPALDTDELAHVLQEFDEDDRSSMDESTEILGRAQRLARWWGTTLSAPTNGTPKTRKALTDTYLRELHARIFTRPAIVAVASEHASSWLTSIERDLIVGRPARAFEYEAPARATLVVPPMQLVVDAPMMEHAAVMRFAPGPSATDLRTLAAVRLHHEALCDGMSAPLMAELRGQQAFSYAVSSGLVDRTDLWDQAFEVEPEPQRVLEAIEAAQALWSDDDLLEDIDFDRARIQQATSERLQIIDAGRALAAALREEILRGRALNWRDQLAQLRDTISDDEARAVGQQYGLAQPALATIIIGPAKLLPASIRDGAMDLKTLFDLG